MKKLLPAMLLLAAACNNNNGPDVSGIHVDATIHRFDKFLFEQVDTNNLPASMEAMQKAYPYFANDFLMHILGLPVPSPGGSDTSVQVTYREMKRFLSITRPLYDSLALKFKNMDEVEEDLENGFKHVKHYFPKYTIPEIVAYVGPFDAPGVAITSQALAIGLQLYGGKNFSFYTSTQGQELYPMYISRRFEPEFITSNAMKAVVEDLYPVAPGGGTLIEQMINKGKQWWLLDKFLPGTADTLKTGYTKKQLEWCEDNEGVIWNFFLQNNDLYTTEPVFIKNFVGESPTTEGMPAQSPGNIGQWVGWQIVQSYVDAHPDATPDAVMTADPKMIFKASKYKPR